MIGARVSLGYHTIRITNELCNNEWNVDDTVCRKHLWDIQRLTNIYIQAKDFSIFDHTGHMVAGFSYIEHYMSNGSMENLLSFGIRNYTIVYHTGAELP